VSGIIRATVARTDIWLVPTIAGSRNIWPGRKSRRPSGETGRITNALSGNTGIEIRGRDND
jgi:hypothetical protein